MFFRLLIQLFITVIILDGVYVTSQICYSGNSLCSNGVSVHYPFWMKDEAARNIYVCGYPGFSISCREEHGGRAVINISNHLYYVQSINYARQTLRVLHVDMDRSECPQPRQNLSFDSTPFSSRDSLLILYHNCTNYPRYTPQHLPCLDHLYGNITHRSFVFDTYYDQGTLGGGFNWYENCKETVGIPYTGGGFNWSSNYTQRLNSGFDLQWTKSPDSELCESSGGTSVLSETTSPYHCLCHKDLLLYESACPRKGNPIRLKIIIGVCTAVGASLLFLILLLHYKRNLFSTYFLVANPSNVEVFLENCGPLAIQRYKYSHIKKMTDSFKEKLGQGGFGSVFKGKLNGGQLVAVKVLDDSKSNGEDFINEVATISRTNHVNVVDLLGFCSEGRKRALVYEYMPNGSLEKFVHNVKCSNIPSLPLGVDKLYEIALGIAKGLEYLHRGCNTRILHFDIKPHNILLDEEFRPKIADFGLAKLCPTRESVVSMHVARGTIGYIAPEVYCRNFGGVSHKSDVYSYGMMVLEMIGGRKNIDISVENTREIYFPQWIYNHKVDGCGELSENKNAKKMMTVALWCIQTQPASRPSINRVVEMLEGNTEEVEMPPNPFQDPSSIPSPSP